MTKTNYIVSKTVKRLTFMLVLLMAASFNNVNAQANFRVGGNSNVMITGYSSQDLASVMVNSLQAEPGFSFKDGVLDGISSLNMNINIQQPVQGSTTLAHLNNVNFKLTRAMVLPLMGKIHMVGILDIAGVSQTTDLVFDFEVNKDQSISMIGDIAVNPNHLQKDALLQFASLTTTKKTCLIKVNMQFIPDNEQNLVMASIPNIKQSLVAGSR